MVAHVRPACMFVLVRVKRVVSVHALTHGGWVCRLDLPDDWTRDDLTLAEKRDALLTHTYLQKFDGMRIVSASRNAERRL